MNQPSTNRRLALLAGTTLLGLAAEARLTLSPRHCGREPDGGAENSQRWDPTPGRD
jgi:hypothetical protein